MVELDKLGAIDQHVPGGNLLVKLLLPLYDHVEMRMHRILWGLY